MAARTRFVCPELIGREDELELLRASSRDAQRRHGQVVLVAGAAGIGKSAFLRRCEQALLSDGFTVLAGAAAAAESLRPFGPFVDVLRAARAALTPEVFDRILRSRAFQLGRLVPEIGAPGTTASDQGAQLQIFDSFDLLFADLTARMPIAIAIDDLHWADDASMDLFVYLARRAASKRLLLLGAYRTDELHRQHPLTSRLTAIDRERATRVELRPLERHETGALIKAALGGEREVMPGLRDLVHERSEGNPFFAEELLKITATKGAMGVEAGAWSVTPDAHAGVPQTIHSMVEARLAVVPGEGQRILRIASVIGQTFEFDVLRAVAHASEDALVATLRAAIDAQLLDEGATPDSYRFRHALTREVILSDLLRHERAQLHQRVGEVMEASPTKDPTKHDRLAYHFDEAGDLARARKYHEAAALEAERRFAFAHAIPHLERALALAGPNDTGTADLHERLGLALELVGQLARSSRIWDEARAIHRSVGEVYGEARALGRIGAVRGAQGDIVGRDAALRQALDLLEPLGDSAQLANLLANRAVSSVVSGRSTEGIAMVPRALEMADRVGAHDAKLRALHAKGVGLAVDGSREGLAVLEQALEYADEYPVLAAIVFSNALAAQLAVGIPRLERATMRDLQRSHALKYGLTYRLNQHAFDVKFDAGRWDEALALYEENRYSEHRWSVASSIAVSCIGAARDGPASLTTVERDYARIRPAGGPHALHAWWMVGATDELRREAEWLFEHALLLGGVFDRPAAGLYGLAAAGPVALDERRRWIERMREPSRGPHEPIFAAAMRSVAAAESAIDLGQTDVALERLERAARQLGDEELRNFETVVRVRRAEVAALSGNAEAARAELNAVVDFWTGAGAAWFVATLVKKADAWGLRIANPRKSKPSRTGSVLTARELEVAHLVADGLANKQIAERLVVSERTAESHVESIRQKLGARNRAQIATWVAERSVRDAS